MFSPKVSVIMLAFNGEKYIGETIESIQKQTYLNWELIIVEDCSTDCTLAIIERYLNDSRIKKKNKSNMRIEASRNKANELSEGKYIAIQDDDLSLLDRLKKKVQFLDEHTDIDAVTGYWETINETGEQVLNIEEGYNNPRYIKAHLLLSNCIGNGSVMMKKEFLQKHQLKYWNNMFRIEDYCFWIEYSKIGNISAINSNVYKHRKHMAQETEIIVIMLSKNEVF